MKSRYLVLVLVAFAAGILARPPLASLYHGADRGSPVSPARPDLTTPKMFQEWRHLAFLRSLRAGPRDVPLVLFGDSITECWSLVPDLMHAAFGPSVVNLGIGSDTVENVLWRVRNGELDSAIVRPRAVALCIGTNNIAAQHSPAAVANAVRVIVADIRRLQPSARIVLLAVPPRDEPNSPRRAAVNELNAALATVPGVLFVDEGRALLEPDGSISAAVMPDLLHPSPEGYRRWAAALARHFRAAE